jgi:hypothetical protein
MRLKKTVIGAAIAALLAAGVAGTLLASNGDDDTSELEALVAHRTAASEGASLVGPTSLADALPNVRHQRPGAPAEPVSESVVLARVADVKNGEGRYRKDVANPAEPEQIVKFDDRRAQYRTLIVTLAIDDVVAGASPGETATLQWLIAGPNLPEGSAPAPENPDEVAAGLRQLGRSLWLIREDGFLADYGYRYVARVDDQDRVDFLFYEPELRGQWVGDLTTVARIRDEGRKPERTVRSGA